MNDWHLPQSGSKGGLVTLEATAGVVGEILAPGPDGEGAISVRKSIEPSEDSRSAAEVKALVRAGELAEARELFAVIVGRQQRRASRIAYHFLHNAAEADEAVQEAFVKVFFHIEQFQEELPFEVWFTRIVINGCLDRQKAQKRRERWLVSALDANGKDRSRIEAAAMAGVSPEEALLQRERRGRVAAALDRLPARQRTVLFLCLFDERSPREVSHITGLNQSTVRVHLFRAIRKLRTLLEESRGC
jgi:RNA polymerase sigma-70 factor, ECF subfamily